MVTVRREGPSEEFIAAVDQRTFLRGVSWAQYEALLEMRGDHSAPRIAYLGGDVEIMSPSRPHEQLKKMISRLLEAWADEMQIRLEGAGSETLKRAPKKVGAEPDECYLVGDHNPKVPDLAIEVIWTSGGLNKLEIYRDLGVHEVWVWQKRVLQIHVLHRGRYVARAKSEVLPTLDIELLVRCLDQPDQTQAVRALRRELRKA